MRRIYLHLFLDVRRKDEQDRAFWADLMDVKALVEANSPLDDEAARVRDRFLEARGRGKRVTVTVRGTP